MTMIENVMMLTIMTTDIEAQRKREEEEMMKGPSALSTCTAITKTRAVNHPSMSTRAWMSGQHMTMVAKVMMLTVMTLDMTTG